VLKSPTNCPEEVGYFQRAITFCEEASTQERSHIMQQHITCSATEVTVCEEKSVGETLDYLRRDVQKDMECHMTWERKIRETCQESPIGLSELVDETVHTLVRAKGPMRNVQGPPPAITSAVLEQIKVLPQTDVTLLITSDTTDTATRKTGEATVGRGFWA
jgi:hypothetical protein